MTTSISMPTTCPANRTYRRLRSPRCWAVRGGYAVVMARALKPLGEPEPGVGPDGPPSSNHSPTRVVTYTSGDVDGNDEDAPVREPRAPIPPRGSAGAVEAEPR